MSRSWFFGVLLVLAVTLPMLSCNSSNNMYNTPSANTVTIYDNYFSPSSLTVPVGTTVTWQMQGTSHSATSGIPPTPSGVFDSGIMSQGQAYQYTFTQPGTYAYFCRIHQAAMEGSIMVQ